MANASMATEGVPARSAAAERRLRQRRQEARIRSRLVADAALLARHHASHPCGLQPAPATAGVHELRAELEALRSEVAELRAVVGRLRKDDDVACEEEQQAAAVTTDGAETRQESEVSGAPPLQEAAPLTPARRARSGKGIKLLQEEQQPEPQGAVSLQVEPAPSTEDLTKWAQDNKEEFNRIWGSKDMEDSKKMEVTRAAMQRQQQAQSQQHRADREARPPP